MTTFAALYPLLLTAITVVIFTAFIAVIALRNRRNL